VSDPPHAVFGADEQAAVPVDLERWIALAALVLDDERVPPDAQMSVVFVDEPVIAEFNERFLGHEGPTDVLAFPIDGDDVASGRSPDTGGRGPGASSDTDEPPLLLGDVVVCPAVAARQAAEHGHSLDDELALLVVHGTLHLLEYDHAEPEEAAAMQRRERELLTRWARESPGAPATERT
jgi:probable rRNA maturation factor